MTSVLPLGPPMLTVLPPTPQHSTITTPVPASGRVPVKEFILLPPEEVTSEGLSS